MHRFKSATRLGLLILFLTIGTVYCNASGYSVFYTKENVDPGNDKASWIKDSTYSPNAGMNSSLWVKIKTEDSFRLLMIENAHLDSVEVFFFSSDKLLKKVNGGDLTPFSQRAIAFHFINFSIPDSTETIYLKIKSEGSTASPLKLLKETDLGYILQLIRLNWLFIGIMALALSMNFIFGFYLKEKIHLYYSLYVLSIIVVFLLDNGYLFQLLYPNTPGLNRFVPSFYCTFIFSFLFTQKYLNLREENLYLRKFYFTLYWFALLIIGINFFDYALSINLFSYMMILSPLIIIGSAVKVYLKNRNRAVFIFIIGWSLYLTALVLYSLASYGVFTYDLFWSYLVQFGNIIEIIVLQFGVLYKIGQLKQESIFNKNRVLTLLEDKEKILLEHSSNLETLVEERTEELNRTNTSIKEQNELLLNQKDELEAQQEKLATQNNLIEEVNALLRQKHLQLEQQVYERTVELEKANKELQVKNHRLEQFAYMAAHNLRGPVATLLGLGQLARYELDSNGRINEEKYIEGYQKTAEKLDMVIQGLALILNLEKNMDGLSESTDIQTIVEDVSVLLKEEIKTSGCLIHTEYEIPVLHVIPVYLNNILYNLISNSIKYKKEECVPEIYLRTFTGENGSPVLEYKDNSLGIDLEKVKGKVFMPFKRFSETTTGIGLGLYMIKVQVEAMHGRIELNSSIGHGMCYHIYFE